MTATYNYAYDEPVASVTTEPPQYEDIDQISRTREPPKYENEMPGKTTSTVPKSSSANQDLCSNLQTAGNAVTHSAPKNSKCRTFLIIVLTLVIGGAVGGVVMYLWTQQTSSQGIASEDCQEVKDRGDVASGQYMISPQDDEAPFQVYCDMETDGGGWTVFQRREDGSVDFFLGWTEYEHGFGDVNSEHWLGNEKIHRITTQGRYELRIDMTDFEQNTAYATYDNFLIANGVNKYKLILGIYSGDAGDSLSYHKNGFFSTKDRDNDTSETDCAFKFSGAWWYTHCYHSNLNGPYVFGAHESDGGGVNWMAWKGNNYSLKKVEMKIRMVR